MIKIGNNSYLIFIVFILLITSCGVTKKYEKVKASNSITAYENFIEKYPESKYSEVAREKLNLLYEDRAWKTANYYNTVSQFKSFISKYPDSKYLLRAENKIKEIEEGKAWDNSKSINSIFTYENFLQSYPKSKFAYEARNRIRNLKEEKDWYNTERVGSISAYKNHIKKYPYGKYSKEAKKKIIDLEVDEIFKGDHGELPSMNKSSTTNNYSTTSEIEIVNNTKYNLTIRYSGPESKKILFTPKQKKTITLTKGNYRVTASVNVADIRNYAGSEKLDGGWVYSVEYYIKTYTY